MNSNTQKTIYLAAASFISAALSLVAQVFGLPLVLPLLLSLVCAGCYALCVVTSPVRRSADGNEAGRSLIPFVSLFASLLCAAVVFADIASVILALIPFAVGEAMAHASKKRTVRISTVVNIDIIIGALILIASGLAFYAEYNTLSPSEIASAVGGFFDKIEEMLASLLDKTGMYEMYSAIPQFDLSGYTKESFYAELASESVMMFKIISPAVIITAINVTSYLFTVAFVVVSKIAKRDAVIPEGRWLLFPGNISSWIFVMSIMVYLCLSMLASTLIMAAISYAALNIFLILLPVMLFCGVRGIVGRLKNPMSRRSAIVSIVIAAVFLIMNFIYGLGFIAFKGAWDMITYYKMKKFVQRGK